MTRITKLTRRIWRARWIQRYRAAGVGQPTQVYNKSNIQSNQLNYVEKDSNLSNWKEKIANKRSATTFLRGVSGGVLKHSEGFYLQEGIGASIGRLDHCSGLLGSSYFGANPPVVAGNVASEQQAAANFIEQYSSVVRSFNGASFMAELIDTVRMFKRPLASVYSSTAVFYERLGRLRRINGRSTEYRKSLAKAWLSYQFGIKPLASEMVEYAIAVERLANTLGRDSSIPVKGFGKVTSAREIPGAGVLDCTFATQNLLETTTYESRYTGAVSRLPHNITMPEYFGTSLSDIVPAAWEIIPHSFILDYFANIGDVLNAISINKAHLAWCELGQASTIHVRASDIIVRVPPASSNNFKAVGYGGKWEYRAKTVQRQSAAFPVLNLAFRVPDLASPKWLNLAALAQLMLESKPIRGSLK